MALQMYRFIVLVGVLMVAPQVKASQPPRKPGKEKKPTKVKSVRSLGSLHCKHDTQYRLSAPASLGTNRLRDSKFSGTLVIRWDLGANGKVLASRV